MREIGVYLHIPFCVRKCAYCDFLSFPSGEELKKIYASALIREIRGYEEAVGDCVVTSVFMGGGTPSVMPVRQLRDIFSALYDSFRIAPDAEITMEMNPGTVDEGILSLVFDYVNRVSLGVQSANDSELKALGRIHSFRDAEKSVELLRLGGVTNLNIDLMTGIPEQTVSSLTETLEKVVALRPEHLSVYSLIVEEGTEFARMQKAGQLHLPDEETEREMYELTGDVLGRAGYRRYEFSNYAQEGCRCRHNIRYWKRGEYLGLGLGAASLFRDSRWRNTGNLDDYLAHSADPGSLVCDMEHLERKAQIEEYMFLGLRMTDGIRRQEFEQTFGLVLDDIYGDVLRKHIGDGLMEEPEPGTFRLTGRGVEISNRVLSDYLLDSPSS